MQEPSFNVDATIQTKGNDPVTMRWATQNTATGASIAIAQLLDDVMRTHRGETGVPVDHQPMVLKIEVTVNHDQAPWLLHNR
jgi:hypothetical protein